MKTTIKAMPPSPGGSTVKITGLGTDDFQYYKNGKKVKATFEEIRPGEYLIKEL